MNEAGSAALFAISLARKRGLDEIGPDELLLGCLQTRSQFGIVELGGWIAILETLVSIGRKDPGVRTFRNRVFLGGRRDLLTAPRESAKIMGPQRCASRHLLAAFAPEETGLMGELEAGARHHQRRLAGRSGWRDGTRGARADCARRGDLDPRAPAGIFNAGRSRGSPGSPCADAAGVCPHGEITRAAPGG